nr:MAG TPA: HNH endonuclease bacteriophage, HNH Endonuclease, DNA.52A [Caudoviricetes sp.]
MRQSPQVFLPSLGTFPYPQYHKEEPMASPGNGTRTYLRMRKEFFNQCAAKDAPCWWCGQPIDYSIPHSDPVTGHVNSDAFELDHAFPRSTHPELAEDPANFRPAHRACNNRRSDGKGDLPLGTISARFIQ